MAETELTLLDSVQDAVWPPPQIKELVEQKMLELGQEAILTAEWPSPREIDQRIRQLGVLLTKHAGEEALKDLYPVAVIYARGGLEVANKVLRPFGYNSSDIRFLGSSSYVDSGLKQGTDHVLGHVPLRQDIEGLRVLAIDEVGDTGKTQVRNAKILTDELGAALVTSALLDWKEQTSLRNTGFAPDVFVRKTERWVVYPWDIYEILGIIAFNEDIWLPESARALI